MTHWRLRATLRNMLLSRQEDWLPARAVVCDDRYPDWDAIYRDNVVRLYRLMYVKVGNHPDAEDLTTEVFMAALGPLRGHEHLGGQILGVGVVPYLDVHQAIEPDHVVAIDRVPVGVPVVADHGPSRQPIFLPGEQHVSKR